MPPARPDTALRDDRRARLPLHHDRCRKVDVRLPGKGNSNSHGARPVHLIITMIKWIRTSGLSMKNSLLREGHCETIAVPACPCTTTAAPGGEGGGVKRESSLLTTYWSETTFGVIKKKSKARVSGWRCLRQCPCRDGTKRIATPLQTSRNSRIRGRDLLIRGSRPP